MVKCWVEIYGQCGSYHLLTVFSSFLAFAWLVCVQNVFPCLTDVELSHMNCFGQWAMVKMRVYQF